MMTGPVLVTGAAGFAGSHLLALLTVDKAEVVAWHRPGGSPPVPAQRTTWEPVDLLDPAAVQQAVERIRPSIVYHCAASAHVGQSWSATESTFAINVRGTHFLLQALHRSGSSTRVLLPSSAMVYRPAPEPLTEEHPLVPASPYGLSKLAQELVGARSSAGSVRVTIGRAFNHVGPRQNPEFAAS